MGATLKHRFIDFQGMVVARVEHITGCRRYSLRTPELKDGLIQPVDILDEAFLQHVADAPNDIPESFPFEFELGAHVRDTVTTCVVWIGAPGLSSGALNLFSEISPKPSPSRPNVQIE